MQFTQSIELKSDCMKGIPQSRRTYRKFGMASDRDKERSLFDYISDFWLQSILTGINTSRPPRVRLRCISFVKSQGQGLLKARR